MGEQGNVAIWVRAGGDGTEENCERHHRGIWQCEMLQEAITQEEIVGNIEGGNTDMRCHREK